LLHAHVLQKKGNSRTYYSNGKSKVRSTTKITKNVDDVKQLIKMREYDEMETCREFTEMEDHRTSITSCMADCVQLLTGVEKNSVTTTKSDASFFSISA